MMEIKLTERVGIIKPGKMSEYKKNPSSLNLAAMAGAYKAKQLNKRMIIIEGNSYMNKIYHIAKENDQVSKYTAMNIEVKVLVVNPSGECFYAIAN